MLRVILTHGSAVVVQARRPDYIWQLGSWTWSKWGDTVASEPCWIASDASYHSSWVKASCKELPAEHAEILTIDCTLHTVVFCKSECEW